MAFCHEAIRLAVVNAGLLGLIAAPTYPVLRDTTQRTFFEILETNNLPYDFHRSENMVTLTELNTTILFRSLEHPERLRGTNLAWFGIDEMTYTHEESFLRLQARLRDPQARELCGFAAWTPNGYDWVYRRFIGPEAQPDYRVVLAQPYENTYLDPDFYRTLLASYDPEFAEQEVLGRYRNLQAGQAYKSFDRAGNLDSSLELIPILPICWSLDFNITPMSSVIAQIEVHPDAALTRVHVLNEISLRDASVWGACEQFEAKTTPWVQQYGTMAVRIYGDATGGNRQHATGASSYHLIRQYFSTRPQYRVTYHYKAANPPVRDRVNATNAMLCSATGLRRCLLHPRCAQLARDLEQVVWETDNNQQHTGKLDQSKGLTHISDALGYLIEVEFPLRSGSAGYQNTRVM